MADSLGDRMKEYEAHECSRRFLPYLPIYARIDGRNFSAFTKGMRRPWDQDMTESMLGTTKMLVQETNAKIGYTQSDEISLVWQNDEYDEQIFFNAKIAKMTSVLAGMATAFFIREIDKSVGYCADSVRKLHPHFDCRVLQLPNQTEAANMFLWREMDATKNAVSMAARAYYSHKELQHKNGPEMQEMLFQKGINFNDYPDSFKRGTFVRRTLVEWPFGAGIRSEVVPITMPRFVTVQNREAVIFDGATPLLQGDDGE